jgi:hypothetical protein
MPMCMRSIGRSTLAVPLAILVVSIWPSASAHGAECVAAPNATAPQGSHWYYTRDPETKRKCWFISAQRAGAARTGARITVARIKAARAKARAEQRTAQPAAPRPSVPSAPTVTESAQIAPPNKIRELIYGTDPDLATDVPTRAELSLRPSQAADMTDNAQPTVNAVAPSPPARDDAADDSAADGFAAVPPQAIATRSIARPASTAGVAPGTLGLTAFVFIVALAAAGSMLYASVRLVVARRRRVRVEQRRALALGMASSDWLANPDDRAAAVAKTRRYAA